MNCMQYKRKESNSYFYVKALNKHVTREYDEHKKMMDTYLIDFSAKVSIMIPISSRLHQYYLMKRI